METEGLPDPEGCDRLDDPFSILGLGLDADGKAVREAYARALREARTAGDDDRARNVQAAFEALRDESGRAHARDVQASQAELAELFIRMRLAHMQGDVATVRETLRSILALAPGMVQVQVLAFDLAMANADFDDALDLASRWVERSSEDPHALRSLAVAQASSALYTRPGDEERSVLMGEAWETVRRARAGGLEQTPGALLESQVLWRLGRRAEARQAVSNCLQADSDLDSPGLMLHVALLRMDLLEGETQLLAEHLGHLEAVAARAGEPNRRSLSRALGVLTEESRLWWPVGAASTGNLALKCIPAGDPPPDFAETFWWSDGGVGLQSESMTSAAVGDGVAQGRVEQVSAGSSPDSEGSGSSWWRWIAILICIRGGVALVHRVGDPLEAHRQRGADSHVEVPALSPSGSHPGARSKTQSRQLGERTRPEAGMQRGDEDSGTRVEGARGTEDGAAVGTPRPEKTDGDQR